MRNKRNLWILSECLWNVATIHCGCDSVFLRMLCMPKWKQFDCVLGTSTTLGDCIKCMPRNIPVNSCTRLICAYKQWRFHGSTSTSCVPLSVKCWHKLHAIFFACNDTLFFVAFWILLIGLQCVLCVYVHRKGCCFFFCSNFVLRI